MADEGSTLRVLVTATNADGTLGVTSAATAARERGAAGQHDRAERDRHRAAHVGAHGFGRRVGRERQHLRLSVAALRGRRRVGQHRRRDRHAYTVAAADEGAVLRALVTATNPDASVTAASAATTTVPPSPPVNTAPPTVNGSPQRASMLTASQGTWSGLGSTYTYHWQHSLNGGATWTAIGGATAATYTLGLSDEGSLLRVAVTATQRRRGRDRRRAPRPRRWPRRRRSTRPRRASPAPPQRTATLAATTGAWGGVGNAYAYQWQHSDDGGATLDGHRRRDDRDLHARRRRRGHDRCACSSPPPTRTAPSSVASGGERDGHRLAAGEHVRADA